MTKAHDELNDRHENAKTHNTAKKTKHNTDKVSAGMKSEDNVKRTNLRRMAEAQVNLKAAERKIYEILNYEGSEEKRTTCMKNISGCRQSSIITGKEQ
jgi:hypothetical protein